MLVDGLDPGIALWLGPHKQRMHVDREPVPALREYVDGVLVVVQGKLCPLGLRLSLQVRDFLAADLLH